jgi:hypothetical protein
MPLRIERRVSATENTLVLEGWLRGPEVAEFATVAGSLRVPLQIDLAHLAGADATGIAMLQVQRARGATLTNASPYIELLLRAHADNPSDESGGS